MKKFKYTEEEYKNSEIYGMSDEDIACYKNKVVKCKTKHMCASCGKEINKEEYALRESGFTDKQAVSCYTCIPCLDAWLDETIGEQEDE